MILITVNSEIILNVYIPSYVMYCEYWMYRVPVLRYMVAGITTHLHTSSVIVQCGVLPGETVLISVVMSSGETAEEHHSPFVNISAMMCDQSYLHTRLRFSEKAK